MIQGSPVSMVLKVKPLGMDKDQKQKKWWLGEKLSYFADHTSVHGWPRVLSNNKKFYKLFWLLLCLTSTGMFLFQAILLLEDYYEYPTQTTLEVSGPIEQFPSITFCNLQHIDPVLHYLVVNDLNGDKENSCNNKTNSDDDLLCSLKGKYKSQIDTYKLLQKEYQYFDNQRETRPNKIKAYLKEIGYTSDFLIDSVRAKFLNRQTFAANILKTRISKPSHFGISVENFINKCYYSIYECTPKRSSPSPWFTLINTSNHFNCYTFNPNVFEQEVTRDINAKTSSVLGPQGGNCILYF